MGDRTDAGEDMGPPRQAQRRHSLHSRAHYLSTVRSDDVSLPRKRSNNGFVFVKDFPAAAAAEEEYDVVVEEMKSLNGIRAALENLEDQLEFFNTIQVHQRAERDVAIARLEQSRIFLARKLSEHQGKKSEVIGEALAFVGNADQFVSTNYISAPCLPGEKSVTHKITRLSLVKVIVSGFDFGKRSLKIDGVGAVLGNAALVAFSMLALLHLHQTGSKNKYMFGLPQKQENAFYLKNARRNYRSEGCSPSNRLPHLDATLARG